MNKASRSHDEAIIEVPKEDPEFANAWPWPWMRPISPGGQQRLLAALRHVAKAQNMSNAQAFHAGLVPCTGPQWQDIAGYFERIGAAPVCDPPSRGVKRPGHCKS